MAAPRQYRSSLREAHSAQTRERIVEAALAYLESNESDTLTLHRIGDRAGVSAPTVYAHFPTLDALYLGIYQWLQPRLGLHLDSYPGALDKLPDLPAANFPAYARYGKALSALLLAPGFHRARRTNRRQRLQHWVDVVGEDAPSLAPAERRLAAFAINAFWMPTMWHWLTETCGVSNPEAIRVASWAAGSLVRALATHPEGLKSNPARAAARPAGGKPNRKQRKKGASDR